MIPHRLATVLLAVALVTFSSSRLPAQSNSSSSSTLAIVGARVVDGSGNEPFDGTVVVRDGRIAEVGRSVRPPDGARIIEAQGKTVMPGLIDIRVHLPADVAPAPAPAPAPAATRKATGGVKADAKTSAPASASATPVDEALVRALAAYLYSGVTTIGVTDIDERKLDLLRDRLSAMKLRAPRLVAASAPANAMFGSTMNGGASASGLAMAEWKQRNATFAPEVTAALASARPAALENVRGAQKAGVRLAIASNAGQGELPHGESTLKEIRALVEAGLTPLQALTAATSGSAWALGLQSDRGFLAVGQRADLIILTGEPGAASGEVAQVAQVFVGGEEVDRAVMHTLMTKPEPVPAPAPAPTAAPTAETTTAAAKPSAEASSASTASTTTAAAKALARGGKRGRKGANATKDANAAAPTEASSSNGKATESTSAAGADPAPEPAPTPTTPAAPAAPAAAVAPIPMTEPLIDDFEGTNGNDTTGLNGTWTASNDSGTHTTDVILGRVVRGLRDHALHLTARMGDAKEPYARISVALAHDGHPADVSHFHGLRFEARGQGRYRVLFITRSVADGRYHESYFSGSPLWTPVSIPFATLGQTGPGKQTPWTGKDLVEIAFQITRSPGEMGWLELDNVRLY